MGMRKCELTEEEFGIVEELRDILHVSPRHERCMSDGQIRHSHSRPNSVTVPTAVCLRFTLSVAHHFFTDIQRRNRVLFSLHAEPRDGDSCNGHHR